ncbi:MAG: M15 family metallopeptidase, partial [Nocardioides sp.]
MLLLVACAGPTDVVGPSSVDTPRTGTSTSSASAGSPEATLATTPGSPAYSSWPLGKRVLPLRVDGFGEIRPTPPSLRDRRYPTADVLPPPADGGFEATIGPITPAIRDRMGETYQPGCPVALDDLRYVLVSFRGFDGAAHTGELVVAASAAQAVVTVFRRLFRSDFPIESMRLITTADLVAPATGDGNNTAAFVCRPTRGESDGFSAHAYGLAVDLNPFLNPYL